ncbi:MAG: DNA cytosine methyltransferase [Phycisphaerales bacterium]|nr:DNA cytosine methyltransferase [Phycisphaerales bacterium]
MKSVELFVGAGGLAIGTARAGFEHQAVVEWNRNACDTLRRNKANGVAHVRDWTIVEGDVRDYDFAQHRGEADVVIGGPPCQPFSLGGKHLGCDDHRNMFPEAVRAVREIAPKAFMFENVKGLLRKTFANYYGYIIKQLTYPTLTPKGDEEWTHHLDRLEKRITGGRFGGLKYNVIYQLLNAADYGVPQHRHRVIIVGIRSDLGIEFSFPQPTHTEDALLYQQWVTGEYWERHRISKKHRPTMPPALSRRVAELKSQLPVMLGQPWRTVQDAIADLPKLALGETCTKFTNHFLNPGARSYHGHNGSPLHEPAKALKAGDHGVPGGENTLRFADGSVRYFSVRECARIQTFPDDWSFEGSWTESMRQLGNAVPVLLGETVAKRLAEVLRPAATLSDRWVAAAKVKLGASAFGNARRPNP